MYLLCHFVLCVLSLSLRWWPVNTPPTLPRLPPHPRHLEVAVLMLCSPKSHAQVDEITGYMLLLLPLGDGIKYRHLEIKKQAETFLQQMTSPESPAA